MTTNHPSRAAALAHLSKNALQCVTWKEGAQTMSAIYWNGKRKIQRANEPVNVKNGKTFAQQGIEDWM